MPSPLPFLLAALILAPAQAQFVQQGSKLAGSGRVGPARQSIVALSADGNTALVGGPEDNYSAGAVWVWTRSAGEWTQEAKLTGSGAIGYAYQGISAALSADGNTALIGGFQDYAGIGAAWVWVRRGGVWIQQGHKLVGAGANGAACQGYAVALSADGNTALMGGYLDSGGMGAAWVFTRSGETWTQQGGKHIGAGADGPAYQGYAAALSADGNTALIGGFTDNGGAGAAWVFTRSGETWTQQGGKLVGAGAIGPAYQGISVALSANGNYALIGGFADDDGAGAAWVFTCSNGVWKQQGQKLTGSGAAGSAYQGVSVALSSLGDAALIGGFLDNDGAGAAWVFKSSGAVWAQQGGKLTGAGASGNAGQGRTVALSGDGGTALIGGAFDAREKGAAWVFIQPIDVSAQLAFSQTAFTAGRDRGSENYWTAVLSVTNGLSTAGREQRANLTPVHGPIDVVFTQISGNAALLNYTGLVNGRPYIRVPVETLAPGQTLEIPVEFRNRTNGPITYRPVVYALPGN